MSREPVPLLDRKSQGSFIIKLDIGKISETSLDGALYTGDFPWGEWELRRSDAYCYGNAWHAQCTVKPDSKILFEAHLIGLLKVLYCDILPFMKGLVLHASCLAMGGHAHVFTGPSGAGKSTISQILPGKLIADDFTPIYLGPDGPKALAGPFPAWEKRRHEQLGAPLASINRVVQADTWQAEALTQQDAITRILENTITFSDLPQVKQAILDRAIDLSGQVPVRKLRFSLKPPTKEQLDGLFG